MQCKASEPLKPNQSGSHMELLGWMKRRGADREAQHPDSVRPPPGGTPTPTRKLHRERFSGRASPDSYWLPTGQPVTVGGYMISGGQVYVGRGLPAVSGDWQPEPALIDPGLPVYSRNPDWAGAGLSYWPSYGEIPPASRAAYLAWLADGRRHPAVPIGYVFLFFYGLERRLLADAQQSTAARAGQYVGAAAETQAWPGAAGGRRQTDSTGVGVGLGAGAPGDPSAYPRI